MPPEVPKLKGTVGGSGAANDPEDVRIVQQLLNKAVANGDLPGLGKVGETGRVDANTLKLLHAFQVKKQLAKPGAKEADAKIEPGGATLQALMNNPLADKRWSEYDDRIKKEVAAYNQKFAQTPGFKKLDWRWVKAMVWTEVMGGPDLDDWKTNPMQIGKFTDAGLKELKLGEKSAEHTNLIASAQLRQELIALKHMDADHSIKAGVAWLYTKGAVFKYVLIPEGTAEYTYEVKPGDNLEKIAKEVGSTIEQITTKDGKKPGVLHPKEVLKYKKGHHEWRISGWRDWETAITSYNHAPGSTAGDPNYLTKVKAAYNKIVLYFAE